MLLALAVFLTEKRMTRIVYFIASCSYAFFIALLMITGSHKGRTLMYGPPFKSLKVLKAQNLDVNFGEVAVGVNAGKTILLKADGSLPVTISSLNVVGGRFAATGITRPLTLRPGQTVKVTLQFRATDHASCFRGWLRIVNDAGDIVVRTDALSYTPTLDGAHVCGLV